MSVSPAPDDTASLPLVSGEVVPIPTFSLLSIVIAVASALETIPATPPSAKDKVPEPSVDRTCPFVPSLQFKCAIVILLSDNALASTAPAAITPDLILVVIVYLLKLLAIRLMVLLHQCKHRVLPKHQHLLRYLSEYTFHLLLFLQLLSLLLYHLVLLFRLLQLLLPSNL